MVDDSPPDRALPSWAIDRLMYGVPKFAPTKDIWGKAVGVAMSAQARGWTQAQFINEVTRYERRKNVAAQRRYSFHRLWEQVRSYTGHDLDAINELVKAWAAATDNLSGQGFNSPEELIANAVERSFGWQDRLEEGLDKLSVSDGLVITYIANQICERQMSRVTCPCRDVGEFAKLPHTSAHRALKRLTDRGFLEHFSSGTWSKDVSKRKAAIYGLSDPLSLRIGGRGAPSDKSTAYRAGT